MSFIQNQKVICIDDVFPAWAKAIYSELPKKDQTYTIRSIGIGCDVKHVIKDSKNPLSFSGEHEITVWLKEIKNPVHPISNEEYGFKADRFVPLEEITEEELEEIIIKLEKKSEIKTPKTPIYEPEKVEV